MATLDPPLNVMRSQVLACTTLKLADIGWIAGASHRQSGPHYPENPPPAGNPPSEVDAIDVPHAPSRGADMAVMTEALRLSRDKRLKLIIFNRRICSSYDHAEGPPWTWRPYREEDPHDDHAHIERNDSYRTDLSPFEIGIDMNPYIQHVMNYRLEALVALRPVVNVPASNFGGKPYPAFSEANVLAVTLRGQADPDVDETKLAELLAPTIRDIFDDMDDQTPTTAGLTEAEVLAAIADAFSRARFSVDG